MNLPPLLVAGLVCAALVFLYTGGRLIARRTAWTTLQFLLAGLAVALTFIGLALNVSAGTSEYDAPVAAVAVILIAAGLIFALVQRLRDREAGWSKSSGIALIGVGIVIALTLVLAPLTATLMPEATREYAVVTLAGQAQDQAQQRTSASSSNMPIREQPSALPEMRQFAVTPLPTQYVSASPAPTESAPESASASTAEATAPRCVGTVQNNLNLRTGPDVTYERILTIPYATLLTIHARSEDGGWLRVEYDDTSGWVSADYVVLDGTCSALPVRES
ncbi:MAG: SH3 domain-containing protein [Anaerolineae bacterium]|nr:SH3 domain-containing protein [Anaerolineae bacterium]